MRTVINGANENGKCMGPKGAEDRENVIRSSLLRMKTSSLKYEVANSNKLDEQSIVVFRHRLGTKLQ
jgi:hypothetical protein